MMNSLDPAIVSSELGKLQISREGQLTFTHIVVVGDKVDVVLYFETRVTSASDDHVARACTSDLFT